MYSGSAERRRIRIDKIDVLVARIKGEEIDSAKMPCLPCKIKSKLAHRVPAEYAKMLAIFLQYACIYIDLL